MEHLTLKQLPKSERPYEKCIKYGPEVLTDTELLAVILRTGTKGENSLELSRRILTMPDDNISLTSLYKKSFDEMRKIKGIGSVKAVMMKCIGEISRRISVSSYSSSFIVDEPRVLAAYYMEKMRHLNYEQVIAVYLNGSNTYIKDKVISTGTVNKSIISPREIFKTAYECDAVYIILLHNHPGGSVTPSRNDLNVTKQVIDAGNILGIEVLDHIIIGDRKYLSFKEQNLIWKDL